VLSLAPWAVSAALAAAWWNARRRPAPAPVAAVPEPKPQPGLSRRTVGEPQVFEQQEPGRGRLAAAPWAIPLLGWRDIIWRTSREVAADRLTVVAGGVTYCTLLAVFPAIGVFVSLYGLFADVGAVHAQLAQLSTVFPPQAVQLIGEQMMRLATGQKAGLSVAFLVSLVLSLWSATAGMRALFDGLNVAYDEEEKRRYIVRVALTYLFTAALIAFMAAVSAVLVAAPRALEALGLRSDWLIGARWPLVFAMASAAFAGLYRLGPSRKPPRWPWLVPGAMAAAALWMVGSAGFSWYLNNIATLDATYGSLGAVIGFMLWVWLSVIVVLVGAELNSEIEHQTALDTTPGPAAPMGERGATMADTVGRSFVGMRARAEVLVGDARLRIDTRRKGRQARRERPPA
jgi:membrane protein